VGTLATESREHLPDVVVAYETYGLARRDQHGRVTNAVLVCHALTGDAHVSGPPGPGQPTPGWWNGVVGEGSALDPADWFIVCANMLGGCQGTTGPSSTAPDGLPWGSRFPRITIRDQVEVERRLADHLGVARWAAVLGGSMGGMRVLEWVATHPDRVDAALVLAVGARAHADQIGAYYAQIAAIEGDPAWQDGDYHGTGRAPYAGMGIARRLAQLTYRGLDEIEARFGNAAQPGEDPVHGGRFAVESYLDHHAGKLAARFDPGTYVVATRAMNTHDVGRGRGGAAQALAVATMPVVVAGVSTDRLYPLELQRQLADLIPGCDGLQVIDSPHGHDAFLLDHAAVGGLVAETLAAATEDVERCA
jgi:homoserine O-acetyltransferase